MYTEGGKNVKQDKSHPHHILDAYIKARTGPAR
jgi:hypothetical protein